MVITKMADESGTDAKNMTTEKNRLQRGGGGGF
jgi:hypothetical protein